MAGSAGAEVVLIYEAIFPSAAKLGIVFGTVTAGAAWTIDGARRRRDEKMAVAKIILKMFYEH